MLEKINETCSFINKKISSKPEIGIILGTGLGGLVREISIELSIPYSEIPNFPVSTVDGHGGKLIIGELSGRKVIAMQGRFHYYEGYSMKELTFPVRVMKQLGIDLLVLSNASGGLNPQFSVGDIMLITDHVNLFPEHPLRGRNIDELGPRFPDMSEVYSEKWIKHASDVAEKLGIKVKKGVYAGVSGPTYETPAEYRYIRSIGADAVGMSTVPEVIVARHMSLDCFALSVITDLGVDDKIEEISHHEVLNIAQSVEPKLTNLVKAFLNK